MSEFDPGQIRVAVTGHLWTGPVGSAFPASISEDVDDTVFTDHGLTTPDGVHVVFDRQTKDLMSWQLFDVVRVLRLPSPRKADFVLMQSNQANFALAAGGGSWDEVAPGEFEYTEPASSFVDQRAFIIEYADGDLAVRDCFAKAINKAPLDTMFRADDSSNLPISMAVLAADGGQRSWIRQTNDEALGLEASALS